jgi:hypothetical protein
MTILILSSDKDMDWDLKEKQSKTDVPVGDFKLLRRIILQKTEFVIDNTIDSKIDNTIVSEIENLVKRLNELKIFTLQSWKKVVVGDPSDWDKFLKEIFGIDQ